MMMPLTCNVLEKLSGKTLCTAESCTGGGIGFALTAVPGSSEVYKGGIISYTNEIKQKLLGINPFLLKNLDREALIQRALDSVEKIKVTYSDAPLL